MADVINYPHGRSKMAAGGITGYSKQQLYGSVFATLTCFYAERHLGLLLHAEGSALRQLRQLRSIPSLRR